MTTSDAVSALPTSPSALCTNCSMSASAVRVSTSFAAMGRPSSSRTLRQRRCHLVTPGRSVYLGGPETKSGPLLALGANSGRKTLMASQPMDSILGGAPAVAAPPVQSEQLAALDRPGKPPPSATLLHSR